MHKLLISIFAFSMGSVFALQTINLDQQSLTCNKVKLTSKTTSAIISQNCKNVKVRTDKQITSGHNAGDLRGSDLISEDDTDPTVANLQKVSFYTDDGTHLKCYYRNNKLYKCKAAIASASNSSQAK